MSVDPLAAAAAGNVNIAALIEAELQALAADAATLNELLSVGDVVQAKVLAPNGLTDLVEIAGQRVAAALPPTLTPGEVITVQVTGFDNGQVQLQIVPDAPVSENAAQALPLPAGAPPAAAPPAAAPPAAAAPPPAAAPPAAAPPPAGTPPAAAQPVAAGAPVPAGSPQPGVAPPAAVFVAASVRPAGAAPPPVAPGIPAEATEVPSPLPGAARVPIAAPPPSPPGPLEARLAAARTAPQAPLAPSPSEPPLVPSRGLIQPPPPGARPFVAPPLFSRPTPAPTAGPQAESPAAAQEGEASAAASGRTIVPPLLTRPSTPVPGAPLAPAPSANVAGAAVRAQTAAVPSAPSGDAPAAQALPAPARGLSIYQEPVALLRALKLPVTPTNVAAAKLALASPGKVPSALDVLERALPTSTDPRITTLRTLVAFTARIDPRSPQLATQISSYVEHVLTGSEPKLAQALAALAAEPLPETPEPATLAAPAPGEPQTSAATANADQAPAEITTPAALPVLAQAQAAERQTALAFDLKTQLFSLAASPPPGAGEALANAVSGALAAITAAQVNAAVTLAANPSGVSFTLPVALPNGFAQAQVRIDRESPETKNAPLDGDNFHIAFVLETQRLGTVAIDLVTVGRTVTLSVKTEAALAAQAFAGALGKLTDRLEKLRYRVAKADASVAAHGTVGVISTTIGNTATASAPDPTKLVDQSA